ncbi:MAG: DsbA family protein [Chloroflexi bacterium]|nr:DsbA family protein [Chloroflexota bacterium]
MARPADARLTRRERRALERAEHPRDRARTRAPARRPAWRSPLVLVSVAAVAVAAVVIVAFGAKPPSIDAGLILPAVSYPAELIDGDSVGRADAPVVIEVYSDFQCPVCGRFAKEFLPRLVGEFVADGRLRIVSRDIDILGRAPSESLAAAVGAACAGEQGRYWAFHDVVFWNQAGENRGAFAPDRLALMADRLGLDRGAWDTCTADPSRAATVRSTTATAAAQGINSTPTLSINGQLVVGLPQSYDALANAITQLAGANAAPSASAQP